MIKLSALLIAGYTIVLSTALFFLYGLPMAESCLMGGFLMLFNLLGIALLWHLVFSKKSIALAVFVIIFKYLILGVVLWNLAAVGWMKPLGLVLGLASLVFAILTATLMKNFVKS